MMIIKKLISIILSAVICMTVFASTVSAEISEPDINKMAAALNKLNILQGSNGDYSLNDRIERSQAIALIIRLLGKEDYVKDNSETLRNTTFSDVPVTQWYAPYVGYSTLNNIVVGNPDGTFTPREYITEKAFVKMALCALGYEYGTDFNWGNVLQKAYEVGLVTDPSYWERTQDNSNYLRSEAVRVVYRSLNTFAKGTERKMAFTLVDEGLFTGEQIAASGIFVDEEKSAVKEVNATAPNEVEVVLNEDLQNVEEEDIRIYEFSNEDILLKVNEVDFDDNTIQIITGTQDPDITYEIKIERITDSEGNITEDLYGKFKGYAPSEIKSDYFRISKVEQISGSIVHVYFTHPISENSEIPMYYEILKNGSSFATGSAQNMTVKKLQSSENAVSIAIINKSYEQGGKYTLEISGKLASSYGVTLGEGKGDTYDFYTTVSQVKQLQIQSAQAWTSDSVRIIFNREVDPVWAGKKLNYSVFDPDDGEIGVKGAAVSASGDFSGREVLLSLDYELIKGYKYTLRIEYIPDIYKQSVIENKEQQFSGTYPSNKDLDLTGASSKYNNCVILTFNKALDKETAEDADNYTVRGEGSTSYSEKPVKAYYSEQDGKYTVKLYLPKNETLSKSKKYSVRAYNLKDALGNEAEDTLEKTFYGGEENDDGWIKDAVTISRDAVKLTFNTEIAFDPVNISTSNYSLQYDINGEAVRMMPIGVTYVNANTLVLRFDELDPENTYTLEFGSITDFSELYTHSSDDEDDPIKIEWGE